VGDEKIYKMKELLDVLEKGISKGEVYITDIVIEGGFVGFVVDEECSWRLIKLSLCKSTKVTIAQSN
jgi:hypothetical protein